MSIFLTILRWFFILLALDCLLLLPMIIRGYKQDKCRKENNNDDGHNETEV